MASGMMEVAALGRPFTIGMLSDAQKEQLIPGVTLWDEKTLQEKIVQTNQHSSQFEIATSDSFEEKSSLLDVDASLKASFLCGLIEVEGSAKYLKDMKKSHNHSRVTCQYKASTVFKQLIPLETKSTQEVKDAVKSSATHVVTGILYGANAFFVFDSEKVEAGDVQKIEGSMQAVIKKIPSFNVDGKVDIKLSDEEKALTNKFTCKFYGDFILQSNPATFEDAVKTYTQLPKLLGENGENGVPLKVWMMPLKHLDPSAAGVELGISSGLGRKAQDVLEDFQNLKMRCNDCLEHNNNFPKIRDKLTSFQKLCNIYTAAVLERMKKNLPLMRAGKQDEKVLESFFDNREKTPFNPEELKKWMNDMEREVNVVRSCVDMMEGAKIVQNQSELDREVLNPEADDVLCFVFTSLETTDPYLQKMSDCLDSVDLKGAEDLSLSTQDAWYFSGEVITTMREKARQFGHVARVLKSNSRYRVLIAAVTNENHKEASIYHYRNAVLLTEDFSKSDISEVEKVEDRIDLLWYACDLTLDLDTAYPELILSDGNKKVTHGEKQSYPDLPQRFDPLPQVLCREALTGRHYWEVELSTEEDADTGVAVCYGGLSRIRDLKFSGIGWTAMSWSLGHKWNPSPTFYAEHDVNNLQTKYIPAYPTGCVRLGVYLDHAAGSLSFYKVTGDKLSHIHTFHDEFSEPVYPCFKVLSKSYAFLCF
ncbi:stonustoxin subunit alpha-like isoform 1-T2 [Odontesthes bonariensis]|uniref:stonustoxin subunit alpha-like n=1 Tax=Odontesthes bonariensis TaxID=219752 RepID=UPI003F587A77